VAGGKFTSVTNINQAAPSAPPGQSRTYPFPHETYPGWIDFRAIPLGDLNLLHKIGLDRGSAVVRRQRRLTRQMYSVRLHGSQPTMTAVVYQGNGAEEVCLEFL
jgi:hypothetical protein